MGVPEQSEGFDEMRYEWQGATESTDYLRKWVLDKKLNSRIEDLTPGDWFKEKHTEWIKSFADWQAKQKAYKNSPAAKAKVAKEEGAAVEDDVDMAADDVVDIEA